MIDVERLRQMRIDLGVPFVVVQAVEDAMHVVAALTQECIETHASFGRHDLARVSGTDRVNERGMIDAARHEVDLAIGLFIQAMRKQLQIVKDGPTALALMHEVVNGKYRRDGAEPSR